MDASPNSPSLHEIKIEAEIEREKIQSLPFRTTQLIFPNPKVKPDLVKTGGYLPTWGSYRFMRPLEHQKSIDNSLTTNQDHNIQRQVSFDTKLSCNVDIKEYEPVFIQTGLPPHQYHQHQGPLPPLSPASIYNLEPPIRRKPDSLPPFNRQNSPTCRLIMEEEENIMKAYPQPHVEAAAAAEERPIQRHVQPREPKLKFARSTAPTPNFEVNSVGMPVDRIPQSQSFNRLMRNVMIQGYY